MQASMTLTNTDSLHIHTTITLRQPDTTPYYKMMQQELSSSWDGRPWPQYTWAEKMGAAVPLLRGELGLHLTQCGLGWGLLPYKVASSSIQLFGHNRHRSKTGEGALPLLGGSCDPSNTTSPGRGLPPYQVASWSIQPFGHNRHGPKISEGCAIFSGGELGPHRIQSRLGRGLPRKQMAS